MPFELHPNLEKKIFLIELPLCRVLMEDEENYPWLFLVPKRARLARIMDLSSQDQLQLIKELDMAQNILWNLFHPTQLNVAAIGNKTPQLHIHVIARSLNDPAWPGTVWDHPIRSKYSEEKKTLISEQIKAEFEAMIALLR